MEVVRDDCTSLPRTIAVQPGNHVFHVGEMHEALETAAEIALKSNATTRVRLSHSIVFIVNLLGLNLGCAAARSDNCQRTFDLEERCRC